MAGNEIDNQGGSGTMKVKPDQSITILTIQEVASFLRVHRSTVTRYAMTGELKSYVLGNRRLFKQEDVLAFFENRIDRAALEYVSERSNYGDSHYSEA
jgi:excisionase family DNA binding protein